MVRDEPSDQSWDARSLTSQQQMDTWWQHWEVKGGEEMNWLPTSLCGYLRISVLSSRHSPVYSLLYGTSYYLYPVDYYISSYYFTLIYYEMKVRENEWTELGLN